MSCRIVKFSAVIALSLALLYSGVAWAMEGCVGHGGHRSHPAVQDHHLSQFSSKDADTHDAVPVIHCASVSEQIGPAALTDSIEVRHLEKGIALDAVSFPYVLSAARPNGLRPIDWREKLRI
jgi:hypothetical protein